jgi:hypothetical protein
MKVMETSRAIQMHADRIAAETKRAMGLHAPLHSAHEAHSVILEELEEFWDDVKVNPKKLSEGQRVARLEHMRGELTQTAAMCLRALVDLGL